MAAAGRQSVQEDTAQQEVPGVGGRLEVVPAAGVVVPEKKKHNTYSPAHMKSCPFVQCECKGERKYF